MPVCLNLNHSVDNQWTGTEMPLVKLPAGARKRSNRYVTIGLINNMPDGALGATERQFLSLLDSASDGIEIRMSFYSLPGVPRSESGVRYVRNFYSSTENLWNTRLDGLIVTGREPLAPSLADEPYWDSFTRVIEWARYNTHSTVWSCLAAHAALLHMDGISRIKSQCKHCGVFECARVADHPLTAGTPSRFKFPHSRWNGIPEDALTSCGYSVLTRAADAGVDTFIKQEKSLFVFFQGHPEYESDTLLIEYRRDVGRYLRGECKAYPLMPQSYFDRETVNELTALQEEAISHPREGLLAEVSTALGKTSIKNTWHIEAACIYRNWLEYICAQKQLRSKSIPLICQLPRSAAWEPQPVSS
jgi:homoserine O-succinyltransferase